jgi:hypothetical protein
MSIDYDDIMYFDINGDEMIDPEEHKARFLQYCSDPAVPEDEPYPYDDYIYPFLEEE